MGWGGGVARPEPDPSPCSLFQFCGATIAGLSLLSPSVMRLVHTQEPGEWLELLLEPGSLYILRYCPAKEPPSHHSRQTPTQHFIQLSKQTLPSSTQQNLSLQSHLTQPQPVFSCRDSARYDFSHEILRDEESFFGERRVPRGRRISVICRSLPEGMGLGDLGQPPAAC